MNDLLEENEVSKHILFNRVGCLGIEQYDEVLFAESKLQLPFSRWKVTILNGMTASTLIVHCKLANDDTGEHVLNSGDNYNWSFKENFWTFYVVLVPF